ncbi:hypothetical protein [uncultured Rikenella sp.]|mgnify:CR=1 FL=1|uniref:hypothetical protein n=1 Tax=uncultured Rikenella sp. TaxID=368003 RepID=UPI0025F640DE|nr:hypothetical protein [uncultured Rikenella sp.]
MNAPGFRHSTSGALYYIGNEGSVWSASVNGMGSVFLRFVMDAAQPSYSSNRGHGYQLRCLSE